MNYYQVLGLTKTATADEIKSAYRRLAKALHPDVNRSENAADQFKALQIAHEVLSDKKSRKEYDYELTLDDKTRSRMAEAEDAAIEVYQPKKERKRQERQRKFRRANVDFEEIPEGFINDRMDRPDRIGGVL